MYFCRNFAIIVIVWCVIATPLMALINPSFTPQHLLEQSETILVIKFGTQNDRTVLKGEIIECIKGDIAAGDKIDIDLKPEANVHWAPVIKQLINKRGETSTMLFAGSYIKDDAIGEEEEIAFLQIDRQWVSLAANGSGKWTMSGVDVSMQGTWDGASDMLVKMINYLKAEAGNAEVPVAVGVNWAGRKKLGRITGKVAAAQAIDMTGSGQYTLYLASDGGDRLWRWEKKSKKFTDVTDATKLSSKSLQALWLDCNCDGKLDLLSWNGEKLELWLQGADGCFSEAVNFADKYLANGIVAMRPIGTGVSSERTVAAATPTGVMLLDFKCETEVKITTTILPLAEEKQLGAANGMIVADLNGDSFPDILEVFGQGSLLYAGKNDGSFEKGGLLNVKVDATEGKTSMVAGDFDGDELPDILTTGSNGCRLWANRGAFCFEEVFELSGEMFTTAGPGALGCNVCDINNDGYQDIALFFAEDIPLIFFNRGFRSFGKALSLTEVGTVEGIADTKIGQQAGVVEDLNGDGAQDMAIVLRNGDVMVFLREVYDSEAPLSIRAFVPADAICAGPVKVSAVAGKRNSGVWNVFAGEPGAFLGTPAAGELTLKWQLPGKAVQQKKFVLENRALIHNLVLDK